MSLEFQIKGIKWEWIINFEKLHWKSNQYSKDINSESLLMRNGTGKTTTVLLLRRLFANKEIEDWLLDRASYKGLISSGYLDKIDSKPELSVDIEIEDKVWTLGYKFEKDYSSAKIFTQAPTQYYDSYNMPPKFATAFENNLELTTLLFIDTQKVGDGARKLDKELVDGAMSTLANVKVLQIASDYEIPSVMEKERKKSQKTGSAKEKELAERALKRCDSTIREINKKLESDKTQLEKDTQDLIENKKQIAELKAKSKLKEQFDEIEKELKEANTRVNNSTRSLYDALIDPSNLPKESWTNVKDYYAKLSKSRIPKSIAKEYLNSVLEENECICGVNLNGDKNKITAIKSKMNNSMGLGILSEVYIMKDRVAESKSSDDIIQLKKNLTTHRAARDSLKTRAGRLSQQLGDKTKKTLETLGGETVRLENSIAELEENITMYESKSDGQIKTNRKNWCGRSMTTGGEPSTVPQDIGECKNLYWLNMIRKNLTKKLEAIAGIEDLSSAADSIKEIFDAVRKEVLDKLQKETLSKAASQLGDFEMQNGLRLHSLDDGVTCIDKAKRTQKGFSTGEELAVIFSLMTALSKVTQMSLPMIVDNPTKGLDPAKLVGTEKALLGIETQLILFIYATERNVLPTYYNEKYVNPSTFKRQNETMDGRVSGDPGTHEVLYDWKNFKTYQPPVTGE